MTRRGSRAGAAHLMEPFNQILAKVKAKQASLIAEAQTDDKGNFEFELCVARAGATANG